MKSLFYRCSLVCCAFATIASIVGCSSNFTMPNSSTTTSLLNSGTGGLKGTVYGGRQPVSGAATYLYGAPNTGYSTPSSPVAGISLLGNIVSPLSPDGKCDSHVIEPLYFDGTNCYYLNGGTSGNTLDTTPGEFQLTGLYQCNVSSANAAAGTLPGQQVWIYSIGGYPGVVGGAASQNVQAGFTLALGTCPTSNNFSSDNYLYMNEVSTVAFAYAVAPFAADATHVASDPGNYPVGLTNAFNNAAQLYDIFGGTDPGDHGARHFTPNSSGTNTPQGTGNDPYYLINSLANVIASCINSDDPSPEYSIQCQNLFVDVYGSGNIPANADTASVMIYIAQNPAFPGISSSVSNLLAINTNESPWSPNYSTAHAPAEPYDLTAAISYTNIGGAPVGIALDASGNAYVASSGGTVSELSPKGNLIATSSYIGEPASYVAIDELGNIWTPGQDLGNVYEFPPSLTSFKTYPVTSSALTLSSGPNQIAADASTNVYISDPGNDLIWEVNKSGLVTIYSSDSKTGAGTCTSGVTDVAFDPSGSQYIWSVGNGSTNICRLKGGAINGVSAPLPGVPDYVAINGAGDGWATATAVGVLYEVTPSNDVKGPYNGGGMSNPSFLTVDGGGNIWIVNNATSTAADSPEPSLSEFDNNGSAISPGTAGKSNPASGYQYANLSEPSGIAVDQAGDVWVTNQFSSTISVLIGAASPTKEPLYTGSGKLP